MHEFALAEAVIATALDEAQRNGLAEIHSIDVRIGELQRISRETFEFALKELMPASEPRLASAGIELRVEPARFRCRPCGREFALDETEGPRNHDESEAIHFIPELAHSFLCCPACRSPDFEVLAGRGVLIESLTGE